MYLIRGNSDKGLDTVYFSRNYLLVTMKRSFIMEGVRQRSLKVEKARLQYVGLDGEKKATFLWLQFINGAAYASKTTI